MERICSEHASHRTGLTAVFPGFHEDDVNIVELDDFDAQFKSDIQDYNWCVTGGRTFPRVWANKQVSPLVFQTRLSFWNSGSLVFDEWSI